MENRRIRQIMPSEDWGAVTWETTSSGPEPIFVPLVAWALVESEVDNGQVYTTVEGLVCWDDETAVFNAETDLGPGQFLCYRRQSEYADGLDYLRQQAQHAYERSQRKRPPLVA